MNNLNIFINFTTHLQFIFKYSNINIGKKIKVINFIKFIQIIYFCVSKIIVFD